jgi:hypothetical protein
MKNLFNFFDFFDFAVKHSRVQEYVRLTERDKRNLQTI